VAVRGRRLAGVSLSLHHAPRADWVALTRESRAACEAIAAEYVAAGELEPPAEEEWLVNGAGAFEVGGPRGDNGLSGKKLVAQGCGSAVPIGGGATCGKDPRKVDPRGQRLAREIALGHVLSGRARAATVWLAYRPGDLAPRWVETLLEGEDGAGPRPFSERTPGGTPARDTVDAATHAPFAPLSLDGGPGTNETRGEPHDAAHR
jgi:S-adenosylmethionine synthetase